jgi:PAS domain S-box-containing protein
MNHGHACRDGDKVPEPGSGGLETLVLRTILDTIEDGILVVSSGRWVTHCNARFREIWSLPGGMGTGADTSVLDHVASHFADPDAFRLRVQAIYAERKTVREVLHDRNGRVIERFTTPLVLPDGSVARLWVFRDITSRASAEAALRERERLLSESQAAGHIGSWELDLASGQLTWTPECYRIYGQDPDVFKPSLDALFSTCALPEDQAHMRAHYRELLRTEAQPPLDFRIRRPDGTIRWLHVTVAVHRDGQGNPVRFVGTQQDLTELKEAEARRLELERQVLHAQKLESLGLLAGGFAHDFNNLLTVVRANLDLAREERPTQDPIQAYLRPAIEASCRGADLCRQILAYSGRGNFVIEPVAISDLARSMANLLESAIPKKVTLALDLAPDLPLLRGDASQIHQVTLNLVLNAAEAIGDGKGRIRLGTRAQAWAPPEAPDVGQGELLPGCPCVVLEVTDDGPGMTPDLMARIFDPFFSTKADGRGLGLAAVQGILRSHKGGIRVSTRPGRGSTFTLFFPTAAGEAGVRRPESKPDIEGMGKGMVLLADDEEAIRDVGCNVLEKMGFIPLAAFDGQDALDLFRAHRQEIRLVILDLTMPRMDGLEAFRELRTMDAQIPVLITSGYSKQEVDSRFSGIEVAGFIQKPFNLSEFRQKVFRLLADGLAGTGREGFS